MTSVWLGLVATAVVSWFLTGRVRAYALARNVVDVPTTRSSHAVATPRGGGAAIVAATLATIAWQSWQGIGGSLPLSVISGALLVAALGFIDDHRPLPAVVRLAGHFVAALLAVYGVGLPAATFLGDGVLLALAGEVVGVVFVMWLINLTNFMDGIDGIAAAETVTVCAVGAVLMALVGQRTGMWLGPAALAAATFGFLIWNWPPAKIFMGDVGSGFLGYIIAVFTLQAASMKWELGWSWVVLYGVFVTDATVTLLRRLWRRQHLFVAHRDHAYQCLVTPGAGHLRVTVLTVVINMAWLTPAAWLVATGRVRPIIGSTVALLPLVVGVWLIGSGRLRDRVREPVLKHL